MYQNISVIGTGNMGFAVALAAVKSGLCRSLTLSNRTREKAEKAAELLTAEADVTVSVGTNADAAEAELIFLSVKPQMMEDMLSGIRETLSSREDRFVLCTMAAGLTIEKIREMAGGDYPVIRMMPNTPAAIGKGVVQYCTDGVTAEEEAAFCALLKPAGLVDPIPEKLMDAASALSGCGPAYVYLFIEALSDGAVSLGLPRAQALSYAAQMVEGAAALVLESGKHPGELKDAVCSPGGTTIQGVRTLEERGFRAAAMDAVIAAYEKTKRL